MEFNIQLIKRKINMWGDRANNTKSSCCVEIKGLVTYIPSNFPNTLLNNLHQILIFSK